MTRRAPRTLALFAAASGIAVALAGTLAVAGLRGEPVSAGPAAALPAPTFVEEAGAAGLIHSYRGAYPYIVGGGVATFDCDGDGRPDLYLAGGASHATLIRNRSPRGGALRFERVEDPASDLESVTGAYPLDIDSDGISDLVVLRVGRNVILRGRGDCRFEDASATFNVQDVNAWTVAFSATWEGTEQLPTLAFGNYLALDATGQPTDECAASSLVRPETHAATYGPPLPLAPGWCTLSMLFSDWDRSGRRDLRVSNDRHYYIDGQEQLWRIEAGSPPHAYTEADGWGRLRIAGMGIASQDVTGDGYPDVVLTSQGDNKLQTLINTGGQPAFDDIALRRGTTAHRPYLGKDLRQSTAWHPEFADVNNDGYADLFISKGNVDKDPAFAENDPSSLLIGQADGTFIEEAPSAGLVRSGSARGAAVVDLNMDGLQDLVLVKRNQGVELWRNVGNGDGDSPTPMGHWIALDITQQGINPNAIGSWIEIRTASHTDYRELTIGGGHASGQLGWLHVGLGTATSAEVRITWPDGEVGPWIPVMADSFTRLRRESPGAEVLTPAEPT